MIVERLERMRDLLRSDAANPEGAQFDLGFWAAHSDRSSSDRVVYTTAELGVEIDKSLRYDERIVPQDKLPKITCDTTGCALGLAALSGIFAKDGLSVTYVVRGPGEVVLTPMCDGQDGFEAGAKLFDISDADSRYFFDPDCYDGTPREAEGELLVAQRIDDFINDIVDRGYHPDYMRDEDDEDEISDEISDEEEDEISDEISDEEEEDDDEA